MKVKVQILGLLLICLLTSCAGLNNSFNRQKYTNLKPIKPVYANNETSNNILSSVVEVKTESDSTHFNTENLKEVDPDKKVTSEQLKSLLDSGETIYVKEGIELYKWEGGKYDDFYNGIFGKKVKVDENDVAGEYYVVEVNKIEKKFGQDFIELEDVLQIEQGSSDIAKDNEFKTKTQQAKGEENDRGESNSVLNQRNEVKALKIKREKEDKIILAFKAAIVFDLMFIVGVFLSFIALPIVGVVLLCAGFLFGLITLIVGLSRYSRYRKFVKRSDLTVDKKIKTKRNLMILGLVLRLIPLGLIAAILFFLLITFL